MSTLKFGEKKHPDAKSEHYKDIFASLGSVIAGAAVGGGAAYAIHLNRTRPEQASEPANEEVAANKPAETAEATAQHAAAAEQPTQGETTTTDATPAAADNSDTKQPSAPQAEEAPAQPEYTETEDAAQAEAERIVSEEQIDNADIDTPDLIVVDAIETFYDDDGTEIPVALVHTQEGTMFLLADIDNNGTYDSVFDMDGDFVTEVQGGLTRSDLELAYDPSGDYMPVSEDDLAYVGDVPSEDIIDLTSPDDYLASNDDVQDYAPGAEIIDGTALVSEGDIIDSIDAVGDDDIITDLDA